MKLLHWCTLTPQGPSNLAAVRFNSSIHVAAIRVFPSGAQPFAACPDIIANTEPPAFFFDIFFNAQPTNPADGKHRPPNALVPTRGAYTGGQVEYTIDMGSEYTTKLMIVKGDFTSISMAIYGRVTAPPSHQHTQYNPRDIPLLSSPRPLLSAIDPAIMPLPISLATDLLNTVQDSPPISLITQLVFCLKPLDDDWDHPSFPYMFADMEVGDRDEVTLQEIIQILSTPVYEDVTNEEIDLVMQQVRRLVENEEMRDAETAYQVAELLSLCAAQLPRVTQSLMDVLDSELSSIFSNEVLDETILLHLLEASANPIIAHHFNSLLFLQILDKYQKSPATPENLRNIVGRIRIRIHGWAAFQDALSNTRGNFVDSVKLLQEVGSDEHSTGIWLHSMMAHDELGTKLSENPVLPSDSQILHPPLLFSSSDESILHDDFISFVRAYIGVASVLAVLSWADSLGNDSCREQSLALLHLWQNVEGYREMLNHLLLLRQLARRLKWITTANDPPRQSGVLAERVLLDLARDPPAFLRPHFVETILALEPPLSVISEQELAVLRKAAYVARDGLSSAMEEMMLQSEPPFSLRRLKILRVSLSLIGDKVGSPGGDFEAMQAAWDEGSYGFVRKLAETLRDVSRDLHKHFVLDSTKPTSGSKFSTFPCPPKMDAALVEELFQFSQELMTILLRLVPSYLLPTSRDVILLTDAVSETFSCTDAADMLYTQSTRITRIVTSVRHTCVVLLKTLVRTDSIFLSSNGNSKLVAQIVLIALLEHASLKSNGRDPVYHLNQIFTLIDSVLPQRSEVEREHMNGFAGRGEVVHTGTSDEDDQLYRDDSMDTDASYGSQGGRGQHQLSEPLSGMMTTAQLDHWAVSVLSNLTVELNQFLQYLEPGNRVHFLKRLINLDAGIVGIGGWLLGEELKTLDLSLDFLRREEGPKQPPQTHLGVRLLVEYKISTLLKFLMAILQSHTPLSSVTSSPSSSPSSTTPSTLSEWFMHTITDAQDLQRALVNCLYKFHEDNYQSPALDQLIHTLAETASGSNSHNVTTPPELLSVVVLCLFKALRDAASSKTHTQTFDDHGRRGGPAAVASVVPMEKLQWLLPTLSILDGVNGNDIPLDLLRLEIGKTFGFFADMLSDNQPDTSHLIETLHSILRWLSERQASSMRVLPGLTSQQLSRLHHIISRTLPSSESKVAFNSLHSKFIIDEDEPLMKAPDSPVVGLTSSPIVPTFPTAPLSQYPTSNPIHLPETLSLSIADINSLVHPPSPALSENQLGSEDEYQEHQNSIGGTTYAEPTTPTKRRPGSDSGGGSGTKTPDILGVLISPPTALLRSPAATGLTKTYANNDFRQLRLVPNVRQNTSRLPSMHVDDFVTSSSSASVPSAVGANMSRVGSGVGVGTGVGMGVNIMHQGMSVSVPGPVGSGLASAVTSPAMIPLVIPEAIPWHANL